MDIVKPTEFLLALEQYLSKDSLFTRVSVEFVRDGALRFLLETKGHQIEARWTESPLDIPDRTICTVGSVHGIARDEEPSAVEKAYSQLACRHLANRLDALLRRAPHPLLMWRNRNPLEVLWGTRLFNNLCPGLIKKGWTEYFDYSLDVLDEYEGCINLKFESPTNSVHLRLSVSPENALQPLIVWESISLYLVEDNRTAQQRTLVEHKVEDFLGYILSRNLPPKFELTFERRDLPAGVSVADANVDFFNVQPPDDSSFFQMVFGSSPEIAVVCLCDRECFNLFSFVGSSRENYIVDTPWRTNVSPEFFNHVYNISPSIYTTIMGSDNLRECLELIRQSPEQPGLVLMFDSCLSRIIGEDLSGPITEFRKKSSIPLAQYEISLSQKEYLQEFRLFWNSLFHQLVDTSDEPEANRICFLGVSGDLLNDVRPFLEKVGLRPGGAIFPQLKTSDIIDAGKAALLVVNSWEQIGIIFSDVFDKYNFPSIELPLPYGIEGTKKWLSAILEGVNDSPQDIDELIPEIRLAEEEFWHIKQKFADQRIGLFIRFQKVVHHLSPRRRFGVPLLAFLQELGFGIDLNIFVRPEEEPSLDVLRQELGLTPENGDTITCFRHSNEITPILCSGRFNFVYTEIFRDERIVSAGRIPLEMRHLFPGFQGALRTARGIAAALKSGFFERYQEFMNFPAI
jgi:hypothetical protein